MSFFRQAIGNLRTQATPALRTAVSKFAYPVGRSFSPGGRLRDPNVPPTAPASAGASLDPSQQFINSIRDLLTPKNRVPVTPFEGSGFYNEADTRSAANQEYDPYYAKLREEQNLSNTEQDRQRLEEVNAAGGFRSSAYQNDLALRRAALARAAQQSTDEQRTQKEQFALNRRNEAYQRYLQSIGALTA